VWCANGDGRTMSEGVGRVNEGCWREGGERGHAEDGSLDALIRVGLRAVTVVDG